jgi:hypothetical protein
VIRPSPISIRFGWAVLFALLLGLRSLAPFGFMPAFDHGGVTIVACPDADAPLIPNGGHHHHPGDHKIVHQPCPYAAVSALGALGNDLAPVVAVLLFGAVLAIGRAFLFVERQGRRDRPPTRGPPVPA